ncbi:GNAT family N-acetyltransferase [Anaerostipes sp.]|uniref:GNAT family N-acetyltransferase n=1 Tax=Anaerostipes sp. TaxID=1872530 RepID=UPI0025BAF36D|nr:GNAT family N-acetyltransferase [Anaerostipes sp.]MBS7008774.1 GNAT family N-acetyltransferase [Anaerostipes sp.]
MPIKLEDTTKVTTLFGDWQETLIWSCLQKVMGDIYVDNNSDPQSAMAVLGDFCFFAGKAAEDLVSYKPENCSRDFMIMVSQNDDWARLIAKKYGDKAKPVTRYAIKKEQDIFDKDFLRSAVNSLKPGYTLQMIDADLFALCRSSAWSRDLVSQFTDYAAYKKLGIGVGVLKGDTLASGASSYARYAEGIEIEVDTKEDFRRNGLAYACGAKLILECLDRGLYPSWDAQNQASVALAEKLGYHFNYEYKAFEIWGY